MRACRRARDGADFAVTHEEASHRNMSGDCAVCEPMDAFANDTGDEDADLFYLGDGRAGAGGLRCK